MKRFRASLLLSASFFFLAPPSLALEDEKGAKKARPNVLFISIDDQNDWIGYLGGHPLVKTPHIDRLAARGTAFTNAHCQSPLCNPSRTSLMTGLRPSSTGIYGLEPWFRDLEEFKDVVSLPQHLSSGGYRTYSTGKIYHGRSGREGGEFDVLGPDASVGAQPEKKLVTTPFGNNPLVDWGLFPHKDEDKGDWKVASWAVKQLDEKPQEPFFLTVGFLLPHVPCYATQKWFNLYPDDDSVLPKIQRDDRQDTPRFSWYLHWNLPEVRLKFLEETKQWRNLVRSYLACTSFVDSQVGRVLAALKRNSLEDNTIVVLWSDHGWHLGEKLITGKNTLWDDGTRVPLIFAGPGIQGGQVCSKPAELLDIYPTLSDLCGLQQGEHLEGHSLLPQLRDAKTARKWPAITTHNHDNHAVRSERWRYIRYADGTEELYDMKKDPNEWNNLVAAPSHGGVLATHRGFLPKENRKPAPGSRSRILVWENGKATWQGKAIGRTDPIPDE
jgi:arylsulfatase A-like enzyme